MRRIRGLYKETYILECAHIAHFTNPSVLGRYGCLTHRSTAICHILEHHVLWAAQSRRFSLFSERFESALVHLHESLLGELFHDFRVVLFLHIEAKSVILASCVRHRVGNSATEAR